MCIRTENPMIDLNISLVKEAYILPNIPNYVELREALVYK